MQAIKDLKGQLEGSDASVRSLVSQLDVTRTELEVAVRDVVPPFLSYPLSPSLTVFDVSLHARAQSGRLEEYQRDRESQLQRHSYTVSQSASQEAALRDKVDALSSDNAAMKAELTAARAQNEVR
ncbi:MAG: hypothetical protein P4L40_02620 [Terracidiphilus sp.]|nr:hypothetical protein [Terracidiphilus sp.]